MKNKFSVADLFLGRRREVKENESYNKHRDQPDSFEEGSLTREKERAAKLPTQQVTGGEFSKFPEIHPNTIQKLKE